MDAVTAVPAPVNEPVYDYPPGSPERASVELALVELAGEADRAVQLALAGLFDEGGPVACLVRDFQDALGQRAVWRAIAHHELVCRRAFPGTDAFHQNLQPGCFSRRVLA